MESHMNDLAEKLETIERLMSSLDIDEKSEHNEVVYDYGSTEEIEENPYQTDENPYDSDEPCFPEIKDEAGTSNGTKRKPKYDDPIYPSFDPSYSRRKFQKIPKYYEPAFSSKSSRALDILDIDCVKDIQETLENWFNNQKTLISLNADLRELRLDQIYQYMVHRMSGNAQRYFTNKTPSQQTEMFTGVSNKDELLDKIWQHLVKEFLGQDVLSEKNLDTRRNLAYWHLLQLEICNMCYVENYICEFTKHYYELDSARKELVDPMFFAKLPMQLGMEVEKDFQNSVNEGTVQDTLGGKILEHGLKQSVQKELPLNKQK